jgi:hypothetical protein
MYPSRLQSYRFSSVWIYTRDTNNCRESIPGFLTSSRDFPGSHARPGPFDQQLYIWVSTTHASRCQCYLYQTDARNPKSISKGALPEFKRCWADLNSLLGEIFRSSVLHIHPCFNILRILICSAGTWDKVERSAFW